MPAEKSKKTRGKYFLTLFEKRKYRLRGQNTNKPKIWEAVFIIKNKGFSYSSINANCCGEEATSCDGINSPQSVKSKKIDNRNTVSDFEES